MPVRPSLLLALVACLAGCRAVPDEPSDTSTDTPPIVLTPAEPRIESDQERAVSAIRSGDYTTAREILTALLVGERLADGRRVLAEESARDALLLFDAVLELDPESADGWFERGRAAFLTAPTDSQPAFFYSDSLDNFENAMRFGYGPEATLWASRAARQDLKPDKALRYAREGVRALRAADPSAEIAPVHQRTLAEATFDLYIAKKTADEDTAPYKDELQATLDALIAKTPEDAWPWLQVASLAQWEEDTQGALDTVERGLDIIPESGELHQRYAQLMRTERGTAGVVDGYERFNTRHAGSPLGAWYLARETFQVALEDLLADKESSAGFALAEERFRHCRELEPGYKDACLGYEVMCRNGIGWNRLKSDDLTGAKTAFLSMEDLLDQGLQWKIEGVLLSGTIGLELVAGKYAEDANNAESLENAAAIYDFLHAYDGEDPNYANNAGFFNRDAAVMIELNSRVLLHRAGEAEKPEDKTSIEEDARQMRARARELMRRSYNAYVEASRLANDDVRVINDTGLIMTYYLRDDVEAAERYLKRAVELGTEQLATTTLEGEELLNLKEAYGDAHQNLGILYLTLMNDPATAKTWFERCVEIGPHPDVPREQVRSEMIPACDALAQGSADALTEVNKMIWL